MLVEHVSQVVFFAIIHFLASCSMTFLSWQKRDWPQHFQVRLSHARMYQLKNENETELHQPYFVKY